MEATDSKEPASKERSKLKEQQKRVWQKWQKRGGKKLGIIGVEIVMLTI